MVRDEHTIRSAIFEDADRLAEIAQLAYQQYLPAMGRPPAPMLADYAGHILKDDVFVISEAGRLAGYAVIIKDAGDEYWLDNIAIDPNYAGRGLGRLFISWIERWLSVRAERYQLYTNIVMVKNISWYSSLGFAQTAQKQEDGYQRIYFSKKLNL